MLSKPCNTCLINKLYTEFHKSTANLDGCQNKCKVCVREYNNTYYKQHEEQLKQYFRKHASIYYKTEHGKAVKRKNNKKYMQSAKGRLCMKGMNQRQAIRRKQLLKEGIK